MNGLVRGPDGWRLAPEGAAVRLDERLAIIADVHLGYEWRRASRGDVVPPHSLAETLAKLAALIGRARIERLIVAGDLVESPNPCLRTSRDVRRLVAWLEAKGIALVPLRGNHDPPRRPPLPETMEVGGWTIAHGDRPLAADRAIIGHHHPVLRAGGITAPCFLVSPGQIALPAFSTNAAGLNVVGTLPSPLRETPFRCIAGAGGELLDFGPLDVLAARLGAS